MSRSRLLGEDRLVFVVSNTGSNIFTSGFRLVGVSRGKSAGRAEVSGIIQPFRKISGDVTCNFMVRARTNEWFEHLQDHMGSLR